MMIKRRTFIKQSGLALAASAILPGMFYSCDSSQPLGLQLYSLRNTIGDDVAGTLEEIAGIGFKEVETYGYSAEDKFWGFTVPEFSKLLKTNGLSSPSGHYGVDRYLSIEGTKDDFKETLEVAQGLNQKYVIIPYISDPLRTSIDDYKRMAEKLNEAGQLCKEAGLKLGYHNHAFEFDDYNGTNGYEVFLENTEKNLVYFEMDIYWVVRAGKDPVELIRKYPGRFPLWHIKDMNRSNKDKNTEIGKGTINFAEIFDLAQEAGGKHFIVEQENFEMDPYKSLAQSFNYIKNDLL